MLKYKLQHYMQLCFIFVLTAIFLYPLEAHAIKLIRFATLAPEGTAWMNAMQAIDRDIRETSGGEVGLKFYPNMSMGDEKDVIRKMRLGQINGAGFTGFGLGEILPEIRILELPYLFSNEEEIDFTTSRLNDYFETKFAEKGYIMLGWADVGWVYFLSKKPVAEPKHLDGLKVWMWEGDPLAKVFFEELGEAPVPLSVTDVHMSLQTGLIDAVYCSPLAALVLQWFTKVNYISDIPFTNSIGAVLITQSAFESLTPQQQSLLTEISERHLHELLVKSRQDNHESYNLLLKEGLIKTPSTPKQRADMKQLGLRVHQRLAGDLYSRDLLDSLNSILSEYRSQGNGEKSK